jgi:hypothetical protein
VQILLQKSKIRRRQKSRESRFRDIAVAARLRGADTKVRGRFGVKRYGPSHREARDASAALKISVHHPKNTFATKSAIARHYSMSSKRAYRRTVRFGESKVNSETLIDDLAAALGANVGTFAFRDVGEPFA